MALDLEGLPGADLIRAGISDLRLGRITAEALLVWIAHPRLRRLGLSIPLPAQLPSPSAEVALYELLRQSFAEDAYQRYNALLRRLTKFARALEAETARNHSRPA
jgi:hypothetical protein